MARHPTVEHICKDPKVLGLLIHGYDEEHTQVDALNSGIMLRECIKQEPLTKVIVNNEALFDLFFTYVQVPTFDIAADAFSSFKELLTAHKVPCAEFLEKNYDRVFGKYKELLNSENYVTKRQSLKLLGELLLDRANFTIMTKYISDPENLKIMMNMLRDTSKNIQFEAFHVFKVFVANPNKSKPIMDILLRNQSKLVGFLEKFHESRGEDEQFSDEKSYLIKQIKELK
jgi:calcium binding protein 39